MITGVPRSSFQFETILSIVKIRLRSNKDTQMEGNTPAPKRRGRPPTKKPTQPPVVVVSEEFDEIVAAHAAAAAPKQKRKSPSECMRELASQIGYKGVSAELQADAISRVGEAVVQEVMSVCHGDDCAFYAHIVTLISNGVTEDNPPPVGFSKDPYWHLSTDERIRMMDEAFAVQDDDAVLRDVKPGPFVCKKCGSNRVLQTERQLRSGDEAATQFFKCAGCKHKWVVH